MPLTIKPSQLVPLNAVLGGLFQLQPAPNAKGRYILARAVPTVGPALKIYTDQKLALLQLMAIKDVEGEPVSRDTGGGNIQFDLGNGFGNSTPEFDAALKAIDEEVITLTDCRTITHAELGACPITVQMEAVLIDCGLLENKEPD